MNPHSNFPLIAAFRYQMMVIVLAVMASVSCSLNAQKPDSAIARPTIPADSSYYILEQYFTLTPLQRLECLDSTIKAKGSSITVTLIDQDLRALLGDTLSMESYCNTTGLTMTISGFDDKKVAALKKSWKGKIKQKTYDKTPASGLYNVFTGDSSSEDTINKFLNVYLKLPVRGRIHFLDEWVGSISPSLINVVVADLNAISGCSQSVLCVYEGARVIDATRLEQALVCWRKSIQSN